MRLRPEHIQDNRTTRHVHTNGELESSAPDSDRGACLLLWRGEAFRLHALAFLPTLAECLPDNLGFPFVITEELQTERDSHSRKCDPWVIRCGENVNCFGCTV